MSEDISLRIAGQLFRGWTELEIRHQVDAPSAFRLQAPSRPDDPTFRELFRPFQFREVEIAVDGVPLLTGRQINIIPEATANAHIVTCEGAALGAMHGASMPAQAWPLELSGLRLTQIAAQLCQPFGVEVAPVPVEHEGAAFARVRLAHDAVVLREVATLAQQRGLLLSSDVEGRMLLQRPVAPGRPILSMEPGAAPNGVRPSLDGANYFSEVTGIQSSNLGAPGSAHTVHNSRLSVLRPHCFVPGDLEDGDLPQAVESKFRRMLSSARYSLTLPGWTDPSGSLYASNSTITIREPRAMIYRTSELLVRTVVFRASAFGRTSELELVLPGALGGAEPTEGAAPWDD